MMKIPPPRKPHTELPSDSLKTTQHHQMEMRYREYKFNYSKRLRTHINQEQGIAWSKKMAIPLKPVATSNTKTQAKSPTSQKTSPKNSPNVARKKSFSQKVQTHSENEEDDVGEDTHIQSVGGKNHSGYAQQEQQQQSHQQGDDSSHEEERRKKSLAVAQTRKGKKGSVSKSTARSGPSPVCAAFASRLAALPAGAPPTSDMQLYAQALVALRNLTARGAQEKYQTPASTTHALQANLCMLDTQMAQARSSASMHRDISKNEQPFTVEKARLLLIEANENIPESSDLSRTVSLLSVPLMLNAAVANKPRPLRPALISNVKNITNWTHH